MSEMTNAADIEKFVYAGRATFTMVSKRTGVRYTFRTKASNDKKVVFVQVLDGPDNESSYHYIGFLDSKQHGKMQPGKKGSPNAMPFKALDWALGHICAGTKPADLTFYHAGKCGCCGRKLTVPESIETGLGPICAGKF